MKQPTPTQLRKEYERLKAIIVHNGSQKVECNPFLIVAHKYGFHEEAIRNIVRGKVKKWKRHHFEIYSLLTKFNKNSRQ